MRLTDRARRLLLLACLLLIVAPVLTQTPAVPASAKTWIGREAEIEQFLRAAEVVRLEDVPVGVTKPKRAYVAPGGPVASFAWKPLRPERRKGYWESYKSEIAAYELDKLLELQMVPVAVERVVQHERGAAIMWLEGVRDWKVARSEEKPAGFERQTIRMWMFDNLICNRDRNLGNILVDEAWNLFLIDHSRAFISDRVLDYPMVRVERGLWERILALDEPTLEATLGRWVGGGERRAMLRRRDMMKKEIDDRVAKYGEQVVFIR
jgi:hypothetical protein